MIAARIMVRLLGLALISFSSASPSQTTSDHLSPRRVPVVNTDWNEGPLTCRGPSLGTSLSSIENDCSAVIGDIMPMVPSSSPLLFSWYDAEVHGARNPGIRVPYVLWLGQCRVYLRYIDFEVPSQPINSTIERIREDVRDMVEMCLVEEDRAEARVELSAQVGGEFVPSGLEMVLYTLPYNAPGNRYYND